MQQPSLMLCLKKCTGQYCQLGQISDLPANTTGLDQYFSEEATKASYTKLPQKCHVPYLADRFGIYNNSCLTA